MRVAVYNNITELSERELEPPCECQLGNPKGTAWSYITYRLTLSFLYPIFFTPYRPHILYFYLFPYWPHPIFLPFLYWALAFVVLLVMMFFMRDGCSACNIVLCCNSDLWDYEPIRPTLSSPCGRETRVYPCMTRN